MLGLITIAIFSIILLACLIMDISIIVALICGTILFTIYAFIEGHSFKNILKMNLEGLLKVKNILIVFLLIGIITALWRASGTIAFIIFYASKIINPSIFILLTFILCSFLSLLIGTSFGTVATMGVICISLARTMGINENFVAGAVMSGIYLGDRNSPMSTSALLISEITKTNLYENIKYMLKTSLVPIIFTAIIYFLLGLKINNTSYDLGIIDLFKENYNLSIIVILPALLIIFLSFLKINVKFTMLLSIVSSALITFFIQKESIFSICNYIIYGYSSNNEILNKLMRGGGIFSMLKVSLVISISSSYSGIFSKTDILKKLKEGIVYLSSKFTPFGAIFLTSIISSAIACNQSLSILLTEQLCKNIMKPKKLAIAIANTSVVIAGIIPWSIAMILPLKTMEASSMAGIYSFYLYLLPLYNFYISLTKKNKENFEE